jgi:hypothetical protein
MSHELETKDGKVEKRVRRFIGEIQKRGGETEILGKKNRVNASLSLKETSEKRGKLTLLTAHGWRFYSNRFGSRLASLAYLCGIDDNGPWAVRIPGTIVSIKDAIDWVEPNAVKKARSKNQKILRQGDVYVIQSRKDLAQITDLPPNHQWNPETRILSHLGKKSHKPLHVPFPCKFVEQKVYRMGRSGRRDNAD